jgi:hypothetical protein
MSPMCELFFQNTPRQSRGQTAGCRYGQSVQQCPDSRVLRFLAHSLLTPGEHVPLVEFCIVLNWLPIECFILSSSPLNFDAWDKESTLHSLYRAAFFFERFFARKRYKFFLGEYLAIYWMKSLDEIAQLLSNSRWYCSVLYESTHIWMNKCTFIYNLDEGGSYTPVKIAFCTT